jgi:23S rRNA pseudouridine1911/1915/1917 synthase
MGALVEVRFNVTPELDGERLDAAAAAAPEAIAASVSRSALKGRDIEVFLNGKPEKLSCKVKTGDEIRFDVPETRSLEASAEDMPVEIIYRDDDIAVVNKPAGIAVHPSKGHEDGTLVNRLLFALDGKLSGIGGVERPGIVHRLDLDTWGLLVVALSDRAHTVLSKAFMNREVEKIYHAVVKGRTEPKGIIDFPIGRSHKDRKKMDAREDGKPALTEYEAVEYLKDHTWVKIHLHTGRTHQIRVHFTCIGHPVAGDQLYSRHPNSYGMTGIALCAKRLCFNHPVTGQRMEFEIELPKEMQDLIARLRIKE